MTLTMHVVLTHGGGPQIPTMPLEYDVRGLPPGQTARIRDLMGRERWRVLRSKDGESGRWLGHHDTAEDALTELQHQVDAGR